MHTEQIFLIGAGGHGKVVLDALLTASVSSDRICIRDDTPSLHNLNFLGHVIKTPAITSEIIKGCFHLAIGNSQVRQRLWTTLIQQNARPLTVIHPDATVSRFGKIGEGSFIAAKSIMGPLASIGISVIVNHGAVIDHDCIVDDFSHIAPNATLGGCVKVGKGVLIGAGANILPGVHIGDGALIGAGSVVITDIPANTHVVGIPAKKIK